MTLADRVVVMRAGVVQQLGRPELIYERPANLFVASFLGNPAINTLAGRLEVDDRKVYFCAQDLRLLLDDEHCMVLRGDHGREVTLGLPRRGCRDAGRRTRGGHDSRADILRDADRLRSVPRR
ncbi:MAG: hypothetical protein R3E83_12075 [Burkholderiaceae bacterium]